VKIRKGVRQECCLSPSLFNLYSKYLTYEDFEGFGDIKIGRHIIHTAKYADDLALLAKKQMELQGVIDRLMEIGRCYAMEMNVEKLR
jgi:hypothetical protein